MLAFIPYTNDYNNGGELRYSIRSLVKYFKDLSGVVVVGDKPRWLKKDAHLFLKDVERRKEFSMYNKVMVAAKMFKADKFLYTNDDFFALKPFDKNLPNYYSGTCKEMALNHSSGRYKTQYNNCPVGWLNYDNHIPIIMQPFPWFSKEMRTDRPIKSSYANSFNLIGTEMIDCKFYNGHSYDQIKEITKDKLFFSTSPFCMNKQMKQFLEEQYPNKSIYEI